MHEKGREVVHEMNMLLSKVLSAKYGINIGLHIMVFLNTDIHETYARVIETMESSCSMVFDDILATQKFVHAVRDGPVASSIYPHVKLHIDVPPYALDNVVDTQNLAKRIVYELRRIAPR